MSTERKREILELLESGKIDAGEAARLLNEIGAETVAAKPKEKLAAADQPAASTIAGDGPSTFRVRVRNLDSGQNKVAVNIPLRMLKFGLKLGGQFSSELAGLDLDEINELMTDTGSGMLVEVQDEESNEHVQVYID
jgi:hypothetical protein